MQKARGHPLRIRRRVIGLPPLCKSVISGTISLPLQGFFSTFPHGTFSLSVLDEYLALANGLADFLWGFTCPIVIRYPTQKALFILPTGLSPSLVAISMAFDYKQGFWLSDRTAFCPVETYNTLSVTHAGYCTDKVWALSRSLAATKEINVFFSSSGYWDVSLLPVSLLHPILNFRCKYYGITRSGLPHSDISGLEFVCNYPELIAACHVLHRLSRPSHPSQT